MRRWLPLAFGLVVLGLLALAWQRKWFGLGADGGAESGPVAESPDEVDGMGALAGRGKRLLGSADPKTFEGDPVGLLTLRLGTSGVKGRVTAEGEPVRFARVTAVLAPPNDTSSAVRTKSDGTFEFQGLPAGELDLRVSSEGHWSRTVRTPAIAEKTTADVGEIALKKKPAANDGLEVKVIGPDGRPVPGAKVTATTMTYGLYVTLGAARAGITDVITKDAVTDDLGVGKLFPLPPEKYDVIVRAPGYVLEAVENVVVASGRVEHVAIALRAGLSISGTVVDLTGQPVSGAYVTVLQMPTFRSYEAVLTDATGGFTLDGVMAGDYWAMSGHETKGEGQATKVKGGDRTVRIELKGAGTIQGQVLLADGKPAPRFTVRPYAPGPFRYVYSSLKSFSDPDGKFSITMGPGTYQLDVKADGASVSTQQNVTVTLNEKTDVKITLPPEGTVIGVVTTPDGDHLAGAEIFIKRGGFPPVPAREQYARADAEGRFVLKGMAIEPVKLHVRAAGYATKIIETTPALTGTAKEITVRLGVGAKVTGRVATKEGVPVVGERINLFQGFDFFSAKTTFTDAQGAYAFAAVAAGDYNVSTGRFENSAGGQSKKVTVPEDGAATADFQTEGDADASGSVQGKVTLAGQAVAGATVYATDERGQSNAISGKTDAEGQYLIKGLKPGRITVTVATSAGLQDSNTVRIRHAGETATLDVVFGSAALRATLVGADGHTTVSGAWVVIETAEVKDGAEVWDGVKAQSQSDNAGLIAASGLEPGTYRMRIVGNGYAARVTDPFSIADGESKDLGNIRLQPGGGVSGRVTDEKGVPLEGIGMSVKNGRGQEVFLFNLSSTGSDGRYELQGIEYGPYVVRFEGKGFAPVDRPVTVASAGAVVDAVMKRGGAVIVRVEDERGQPIQGARVALFDASGAPVKKTLSIVNLFDADVSRTNDQGTTRIPDLAPGGYRISASKDGLVAAGDPVSFTVASSTDGTVTLVLKAAP